MDKKDELLTRLLPMIGGAGNMNRHEFSGGELIISLKDRGEVDMEQLSAQPEIKKARMGRCILRLTLQGPDHEQEDMTMAVDNKQIAKDVLDAVGGKPNVQAVTHCMTRLRFNLKNMSIPDPEQVKKIPGVLGVAVTGGQFQVIIGQNVPKVYEAVCGLAGVKLQAAIEENLDKTKKTRTAKDVGNAILNYLSGSLTPLIPLMMAGAMSKTVLTLFGSTMLGLIADGSSLAILLDFVYDASFYFFPIYIGYTAAKKLDTSVPIGMMLGGILLAPDFMALIGTETPFTVYGIPCAVYNYSSTVAPILLSVWVMSYVYRFFAKRMPNALTTIFTPFLTVAVMLPIMLCGLAPLGNAIGNYLALGMQWMSVHCGFLAVAAVGALYQILVITGMHSPLVVMCLATLFSTGSDSLLFVGASPAIAACAGIGLGALLRLRDKGEKGLAAGYLASVLLSGITEPTLYGLCVKYKRPFVALVLGGAVGGLYAGITRVTYHALISVLLLAPFSYTAGGTVNMINGTISMVIGFAVAAVLTYFFGFSREDLEADRQRAKGGERA